MVSQTIASCLAATYSQRPVVLKNILLKQETEAALKNFSRSVAIPNQVEDRLHQDAMKPKAGHQININAEHL